MSRQPNVVLTYAEWTRMRDRIDELRDALELCLRGLKDAMTYGGVSGPIFDKAIEAGNAALPTGEKKT